MYAHTPRRGGKWLAILALAALMAGACGEDAQDSAAPDPTVATTAAVAATAAPETTAAPTTTEAPETTTAPTTTTTAAAPTTTEAPSAFPVDVQDSLGVVTIPARPERIVSLSEP